MTCQRPIIPAALLGLGTSLLVLSPALCQTVTIVSVSAAGKHGNSDSFGPVWSPDGTHVTFYTQATNLFTAPDPNSATYLASKTIATGAVTDLAVGAPTHLSGVPTYTCTLCQTHPQYSANGSTITFFAQAANGLSASDTSGNVTIYEKNLQTGIATLISSGASGKPANGPAYFPQMAKDGTFVVFQSDATNMTAGIKTRPNALYEFSNQTMLTIPLSGNSSGVLAAGGTAGPAISPDETTIAFESNAQNLIAMPPGSTNILLRNLSSGAITIASTTTSGVPGDGLTTHAQWCAQGGMIAFQSNARALGGDGKTLQVYVKSLNADQSLQMVSVDADGNPGNGSSSHPAWSPDCTKIAMDTRATNFAADVPAGSQQIIVKHLATGIVTDVSLTPTGLPADNNSNHPQWSPDGTHVAFTSTADNLVPNDTNHAADVFIALAP